MSIFIGARTHSTIAALSLNIPSIIISYSIKSIGINRNYFDNDYFVLNCNQINSDNLLARINDILNKNQYYKDLLIRKNKLIKDKLSKDSLDLYNQIINKGKI